MQVRLVFFQPPKQALRSRDFFFQGNHATLGRPRLYTATATAACKLQTGYRLNRRFERNLKKGNVVSNVVGELVERSTTRRATVPADLMGWSAASWAPAPNRTRICRHIDVDLSLNEKEQALVDLCRDFAEHEIARRAPLAWDEARCPTDLLREMGGLGLLGILVPRSGAGSACPRSASSRHGADRTGGPVGGRGVAGSRDHRFAAAVPVRQRRPAGALAAATRGGTRARRIRLTEPDAGSDARGIRTHGGTPRRWLAHQRPQDLHLQCRHGHVLRCDAAGAHGVGRGPERRRLPALSSRRTRPGSPWARRCAASGGVASTPASCTSTTSGSPTIISSAIPTWDSASSCGRSRSDAFRSPRCR